MSVLSLAGGLLELEDFCQKRLDNIGGFYNQLGFFSLSSVVGDVITPKLKELIRQSNLKISVHIVEANLTDVIDADILDHMNYLCNTLPIEFIEEDLGIWRYGKTMLYGHMIPTDMSLKSANIAIKNIQKINNAINCPFLVENPPTYYIRTEEFIDFWDYYEYICSHSNCGFSLDVGHYTGYCVLSDIRMKYPKNEHKIWKYLNSIHLSGEDVFLWNSLPVWLDKHGNKLNKNALRNLQYLLPIAKNLKSVLLEQETATFETIAENFKSVIDILKEQGLYDE